MKKVLLFLGLSCIIFLQFDVRGAQRETASSAFARSNRMILHYLTSVTKNKQVEHKKEDPSILVVQIQFEEDLSSEQKEKQGDKAQHEQLSFVTSNRMILSSLALGVDKKKKEEKENHRVSCGGLLESRVCDEKVDKSYVPHNFLRNHLAVLISDTKSLEDVDTEQK
jgi:hypothetical protein